MARSDFIHAFVATIEPDLPLEFTGGQLPLSAQKYSCQFA